MFKLNIKLKGWQNNLNDKQSLQLNDCEPEKNRYRNTNKKTEKGEINNESLFNGN